MKSLTSPRYHFYTSLLAFMLDIQAFPRDQEVTYLGCQAGDKEFIYRVLACTADPIQLWIGPDRWLFGGEGTFVSDERMRFLVASDDFNYINHWAEIDRIAGTYVYREGLGGSPREMRGTCKLTTEPRSAPPSVPPARKF